MSENIAEEAKLCSQQGNGYPFCSPTTLDVWKNGTTHDFVWNWNFPYYVGSENISLYLYYYIKFEYILIKNYTYLNTSTGGFQVTVDDSWFLTPISPGSSDQNLTIYGYYLPSNLNNTEELTNTDSMYPRPFNFTVTQTTSSSNSNNASNNGNINTSNHSNSNISNSSSSLPGWAIAVIVIAVIAFICGATALFWTMILSRRNKNNNKLTPKDSHSLHSQAKMMSVESVNESSVKTYIDGKVSNEIFEEEMKRRRLGEALLQRQLEEDGTFVRNAGRLTRVKSLTDIPKSAVFEQK